MADGMHFGRKAIVAYLNTLRGVTTWRTVQKWKKSGAIIIRYTAVGQPFIIEAEIKKQLFNQSETFKKKFHP